MIKNKLSVIIPDRNGQPYLQKTIDDLLGKAEGEIEVIVVSDGTWPNPPLTSDPRVLQIHHGTHFNNPGMKTSIMRGIAISTGEFIMKTDEHTMFDQGFDTKLKADCYDNWVVIPRRYRLDGDEWIREDLKGDKRPPVDYMYLAYPYERKFDKTCGLHGAEDRQRYHDRKDIFIDDTMSMQGSNYFMRRSHWDKTIKQFDLDLYGQFTMEAQEIGNKTWFSGGQVMVNKKTWYAHMHKGKNGKGYGFSNAQYEEHRLMNEMGRLNGIDYWINNKWPERVHDFAWLLEKFWPVPGWTRNWQEQIKIDEKFDYKYSEGYNGK